MSQEPNNSDENDEFHDINSFLENMNRTIAENNRRRRSSQTNINRIFENRSGRNIREELESFRCNYVVDINSFCQRYKSPGSLYCNHHRTELRLPVLSRRPGRQNNEPDRFLPNIQNIESYLPMIRPMSSNVELNVSSINHPIQLDISSSSNVELNVSSMNRPLDISSSSNVELNVSSMNRPLDISSSSNVELNVSSQLDISSSSSWHRLGPPMNLSNLMRNINGRNENNSSLNRSIREDKCGKCTLCQKTVSSPFVTLRCDHKYHLKCFLILNTDSENKINLMDKCTKCDKKLEINLDEPSDCSICLEKLIDDDIEVELPCKHRFHIYCINSWTPINNNCPLCRANI